MNIIVASSRGKGMESLADPPYTYIRVRSGGKILDLAEVAIKIISDNYHRIDPSDPIFVYFLAGLPDTTSMIKQFYRLNGMYCCYQEVTFPESPDQAYLRITDIIQAASDRIKSFHAIPVFATYAPSSLSVWSRTRLLQHKTSHLNHFSQYPAGAGRVPNVPHKIVAIWRRAGWAPFLPLGRRIGPQYVDTCKM